MGWSPIHNVVPLLKAVLISGVQGLRTVHAHGGSIKLLENSLIQQNSTSFDNSCKHFSRSQAITHMSALSSIPIFVMNSSLNSRSRYNCWSLPSLRSTSPDHTPLTDSKRPFTTSHPSALIHHFALGSVVAASWITETYSRVHKQESTLSWTLLFLWQT